MNVNCPHCGKQMKLGGKIQSGLEALAPGQQLRVKCIQCAQPFGIDASMAGASVPVSQKKPPSDLLIHRISPGSRKAIMKRPKRSRRCRGPWC